MSQAASGFLVVRRDDGFGDVYPLQDGNRYTMGRAPDNRIVLKDDLCSRRHAEVYKDETGWILRDLGSLNGCQVNDRPTRGDVPLRALDAVKVGRGLFVFVQELDQLPSLPAGPAREKEPNDGLEITRRTGRTKYIPPPAGTEYAAPPPTEKIPASSSGIDAVQVLYRLALDSADAKTQAELAEMVAEAILQATPAAVVAVLALKEGKELEPVVYRTRNPSAPTYHKVSQFVSQEVMSSKQAVLAEDVDEDRSLKNRESLAELRVGSLICAPVLFETQTLGLLHLYTTVQGKPLTADHLDFAVAAAYQLGVIWHKLRRSQGLTIENQALRDQLRVETELVGRSPALEQVERQIARVAGTKATVLIRGESGVGKELVARAIHFGSPRKESPFVCLNCAALTETLLESELFGHEKGAFTGATDRMIGKFEASDQGTIFLDEIGEMAANTQAKLLRVLEGQPFERVGGNTPIKVDVRVVAATNRPLEEGVRTGQFRKDLYFRLQVVQIDVPPLRDRADDVPAIAEHFLRRFVRETGRKIKGFSPAAVRKLQGYHWPGNVRELRNVVERAVALGMGPTIDEADIWLSPLESSGLMGPQQETMEQPGYVPLSLEALEKQHIRQTLEHTNWNKSQAATILGIERSTLDRKIKSYDLKK